MAALSRNTASVAQDFHNAGGGVKTIFNKNITMDDLCKSTSATNQQQFLTTIGKQQQIYSNNRMASNNVSPPANLKIINHSSTTAVTKKRRKISQEKENENINLLHEYFDNKLMQRLHSDNNFIHHQPQPQSFPEIQIANESIWFPVPAKSFEKRNRKQSQPRKIEKNNVPAIASVVEEKRSLICNNNNKLLDKHLLKMVSKKKRCNICEHKNKFMIMPYHKKSSLILHNLWRHKIFKYNCKHPNCDRKFNMKYKLKIHLTIGHK